MSLQTIWFCVVLLIGSGMAADVPYVFGEDPSGYTSDQLEEISTSSSDLVGVSPISATAEVSEDLMEFYNVRVEPENPIVHNDALIFAGYKSGKLTIDQICSIYKYLRFGDSSTRGWIYKSDPRGLDYYAYANETLKTGKEIGCTGSGDCDDFAILMSSLIESIGGTTRMITTCNNDTCHIYTEVYIGQLNAQNNQVNNIINELKQALGVDKIYTHIDTTTWDVWLNLDWFSFNPGGPFISGNSEELIYVRDYFSKTPLNTGSGEKEQDTWSVNEMALFQQGKYDEVMQDCDKAIGLNPKYENAWNLKGAVFLVQGKYDEALQAFNKSIELDPKDAEGWNNKGSILLIQDKQDEALQAYEKAIELNPNYAAAWEGKGTCSSSYDKKLQAFEKAIELDPHSENAWSGKGLILLIQGKLDEALQAFEKAIEIDPQNPYYWKNKWDTLNRLNRNTEADAAYAKVIELGGDSFFSGVSDPYFHFGDTV